MPEDQEQVQDESLTAFQQSQKEATEEELESLDDDSVAKKMSPEYSPPNTVRGTEGSNANFNPDSEAVGTQEEKRQEFKVTRINPETGEKQEQTLDRADWKNNRARLNAAGWNLVEEDEETAEYDLHAGEDADQPEDYEPAERPE